jgi:fluoride exporter
MSSAFFMGAALLGGLGAVARFLLDGAISEQNRSPFPFGTLAVNLLGTLTVGVMLGAGITGKTFILVSVGFLGAFTTFSTWMFETHRLAEDGQTRVAATNLAASFLLGMLVILVGKMIGEML